MKEVIKLTAIGAGVCLPPTLLAVFAPMVALGLLLLACALSVFFLVGVIVQIILE